MRNRRTQQPSSLEGLEENPEATKSEGRRLKTGRKAVGPNCKHPSCDRESYCKGYCNAHYRRSMNGKPMDAPISLIERTPRKRGKCSYNGCSDDHYANGLCKFHYSRNRAGKPLDLPRGSANSGEFSPNWKGGAVLIGGRVAIKRLDHPDTRKNGYVFRYRLIAEEKIGRRLLPDEDVHHINGIKTDDRPENLAVLSKSEHTRIHSLERWKKKKEQS